jgi:hypothetical protein
MTIQTTHNDYLNDTVGYMNQIITMFAEFNINCRLNTKKIDDIKTSVFICFNKNTENLIRYADVINYTYCEEKRRASAPIIEHLKIIGYNKLQRDINYQDFIKQNIVHNGCVSVPILSITEIEPELVYDFTTRSENHSFVASSFVSSNCVAETPEGQSVGVVKNLSYMTHVTIHSNTIPIYEYVHNHITIIENLKPADMFGKVKVFINGAWIGITDEPLQLYNLLKEKKYKGIINIYTSIVFDYKMGEIRVCNDGGRLSRPVLRVKNQNLLINKNIIDKIKKNEYIWDDLLTNCKMDESVLEYIDPEEQSWSLIAMKPRELIKQENSNEIMKYTHCEIHPSTIFGVLASCIPFPEHNQSPRNTYQCLDINETVLMSDGRTKKRIADVKVGDEVITFHPKTLETEKTKVIHQYVRETDKKIYEIKTISGRKIIATEDHQFMTNQGWKPVDYLISTISDPWDNIKIGIYNSDLSTEYNLYLKYEISKIEKTCDTDSNYDIHDNMTYEEFVLNQIDVKGKCLFVAIDNIVETTTENNLVSDITVESNNHSFIAGNDFLSHNCAQAKQAMGVYVTNYQNRMDKTAYVLNYPARPLVDTRIMDMIHINKIPSGLMQL